MAYICPQRLKQTAIMLEKLNRHKWWIIIAIGLAMVIYIVLN